MLFFGCFTDDPSSLSDDLIPHCSFLLLSVDITPFSVHMDLLFHVLYASSFRLL